MLKLQKNLTGQSKKTILENLHTDTEYSEILSMEFAVNSTESYIHYFNLKNEIESKIIVSNPCFSNIISDLKEPGGLQITSYPIFNSTSQPFNKIDPLRIIRTHYGIND